MKLKLLNKDEFDRVEDGVELFCIDGTSSVKGKDEFDDDTRGGYLPYGVKLADDAPKGTYNWDTEL